MSAYNDRLIQHIETNNNFIQPENCRNSILSRLHKDGLRDLSISRTTFEWGISMPDGFDSKHVMYVWFDALTNYISGVHGLDIDHPLAHYWPAQKHIIGKDIIWFHCVMLWKRYLDSKRRGSRQYPQHHLPWVVATTTFFANQSSLRNA